MIHSLYLLFALVGFSFFNGITTAHTGRRDSHEDLASTIFHSKTQTFNPLDDALNSINETLLQEKKRPHMISLIYKLQDNKPVSVIQKTHFKEYRKPPKYVHRTFKKDESGTNKSLEFIYKPSNKGFLVQVSNESGSKKNISRIKLSTHISDQSVHVV